MIFCDDLILDESRLGRFLPGLPGLTTHQGCSTLSGPNITLHSLGSSRVTVEADKSRSLNPVQARDVTALYAACDAAGGTLDQGDGWWLVKEADGFYRKRRGLVRDPAIYRRVRQAEHVAAWLSSGPHYCGECGIDMPAGHYGREKRFCKGHGPRPARKAPMLTCEEVTARRLVYNQRRNESRLAERVAAEQAA